MINFLVLYIYYVFSRMISRTSSSKNIKEILIKFKEVEDNIAELRNENELLHRKIMCVLTK
jgi:hypothetical protein